MKSNKFLIASLLILVGIGAITISCKKEKRSGYRKAKLVVESSCEKTGDDDNDPMIQGRVKKKLTFVPVDSALVEVMLYSPNLTVGTKLTDRLGEFSQRVDTGTYYFKVTVPGFSTSYITDTVFITNDKVITILVD